MDYGFSISAHKSQGSTYDTVMVDVNDIVYDKYGDAYTNAVETNKRLYVACSRCKNKLFIRYGVWYMLISNLLICQFAFCMLNLLYKHN